MVRMHAPNNTQHQPCRVELISWQPRAFYYHNLISSEEADTLLAMAKPRVRRHVHNTYMPTTPQMQRSTVVGSDDSGVVDNIRTSYGTFLKRRSHPLLDEVARRLAHWTHLNMSHQEDMQILRYGPGQKYGAHMDVLQVC